MAVHCHNYTVLIWDLMCTVLIWYAPHPCSKGPLCYSGWKAHITVFRYFQLQTLILSSPTNIAAQHNICFISATSHLVTFSRYISFLLSLTSVGFYTFHCVHVPMSASGNKENIGMATILISKNTLGSTSEPLNWIQFDPAAAAAAQSSTPQTLEKPKKASWKLAADDETLVLCLKLQQAAGNQSDTGLKPVTWTACAIALQGSEKWSVSGPKTAKS